MSEQDKWRIVARGKLPLAVCLWSEPEWCHQACFQRWSALSDYMKGAMGGHVHYADDGTWRVPESGCPPLKHLPEWQW